MQLGTPEHKGQFLQDLTKTYQENIWKEELAILEFEDLLGQLRKEKAEISLKLDNQKISNCERRKESTRQEGIRD